MTETHAAIDIGTNSFHLVVARGAENGGFEVVTTEKEMVRLGSGGGDMKRLAPDAIERGIAALARMLDMAHSLGADVTAVATSAVREAENRAELVGRVRNELGLEISVISGYEEARLIHHGVIHAVPVGGRRPLVVDIGGGSTELIVGHGIDVLDARSLRLGAIRLTQRFFDDLDEDEHPSELAIDRCRHFLKGSLAMVSRDLELLEPELAIGSSGTIRSLASMIAAAGGDELSQVNGYTFTREELAGAVESVLGRTTRQRRSLPGLDDRRADIIVGGCLLLDEIFLAFELSTMTVSDYALREGVMFDRFPAGADHLHDLRRSNAVRLAQQFDTDFGHAETTARLATDLFDRTRSIHGLTADARELLDVASLVHNIGLVVSHSGHHKHSAYLVRNSSQLTGFSERELELVALIARYHRKSRPSAKHPEFAVLDADDQRLVRLLAGMLRVAIGLDRRHNARVSGVAVSQVDPDRLVIEALVDCESEVELEVHSANARAGLLADALGIELEVTTSNGVRDREATA